MNEVYSAGITTNCTWTSQAARDLFLHGHAFFNVAEGESVSEIPTHGEHDHLSREPVG
jgi:hypothetical protein